MKRIKGNSPENYIFLPGTKVYAIYLGKKDKREKCEVCRGKGDIKLSDGKYYSCPACYGIGSHWVKTPVEWILDDYHSNATITHVDIRSIKDIVYYFNSNGIIANDVFLTKSEALKELSRRNKILRQKELNKGESNE